MYYVFCVQQKRALWIGPLWTYIIKSLISKLKIYIWLKGGPCLEVRYSILKEEKKTQEQKLPIEFSNCTTRNTIDYKTLCFQQYGTNLS